MKKLIFVTFCAAVILSITVITGCKGKDTGSGLNQSLNNADLISDGKGKDFGFGPIGFDLDTLVDRLGRDNVKKLRIGVSMASLGTQWMDQFAEEIQSLGRQYGFDVVVLSAESNEQKQADDLKSFQSQQVDGILIYPHNPEALAQTMTEVHASGIPIVSCVAVDPAARIAGYVNVSQEAKGAMMADHVAKDAGGAERNIMVSDAGVVFPVLNDRLKGFEDQLKKYPNLKIVEKRLAAGDAASYLDVINEGLLANDTVDVVYATFAWPILGAYNAGKQLNRNLLIYGVDADESLLQLLAAGDMITGLHAQFAGANAYTTLFTLFRYLAGEQIPYETWEADAYANLYASKENAALVMSLLYGK